MTIARRGSSPRRRRSVARRFTWLTLVALVWLTTAGSAQRTEDPAIAVDERVRESAPAQPEQALDSARRSGFGTLPPAAQARIAAAIGEDEPAYHAVAEGGRLRMDNPARGVSAEFTPEGVSFRGGAHRWGMTLRGYGYGEDLREPAAVDPRAAVNRVEYRRGALTEWYVNGPLGIAQGFTLERGPDRPNGEPLALAFALSGNLTASVDAGGRGLTLRKQIVGSGISRTDPGVAALRYGGLAAFDADGRDLRAWLEVAGPELRVRVDDAGARYPLTIDPYVEAVKLTTVMPCDPAGVCDDGAPGDEFGYSVSISADASTIVVGSPFKYTNSFARGAAYVFVRPSDFDGGWNSIRPIRFRAKLLASDGATSGRYLGWSLDISRDGGTIVAGAPALVSDRNGAVYVFVKPANGWESAAIHTETAKLVARPATSVRDTLSLGDAVTISGDGRTIAAGEPTHRISNILYGAVYVFLMPANGWLGATESQKIIGTQDSHYGDAVALSDDASILAVGASGNPYGSYPNDAGAAYVLARKDNPAPGDAYATMAKLIPSDGIPFDIFGWSIGTDADGSTVAVGAPGDGDRPRGGVYVFPRPPGGWDAAGSALTETAKLTTSDGNGSDALGVSVDMSLDGRTIVAGTWQKASAAIGSTAAYFFERPAAGWSTTTEDTRVIASDWMAGDLFGWSAALSGDGAVVVVGAPFARVDANLQQGLAYVFTGSAPTPSASIAPSSLAFGPQPLGTTSAPQTVTVTNTGSAPLHVSSVGASASFTATENCVTASPIAPGDSCFESVVFAPASVGPRTGTLSFTTNSGGGTVQHVPLQGTGGKGHTSTAIVSVSANQIFVSGSMFVSFAVSAEPSLALTPSGTVTVQASTGESCMSGVVSNGCTLSFSTLGTRTISATYNGNVNFNPSTSPGVLVRVVDFSLSASPASQSVSGRKATYKVTVTGLGGLTGTVSLTCTGGPADTTCAMAPASVALPGSTPESKATVTLPVNAAKGTYTIVFRGTYEGVTRKATASLTVK